MIKVMTFFTDFFQFFSGDLRTALIASGVFALLVIFVVISIIVIIINEALFQKAKMLGPFDDMFDAVSFMIVFFSLMTVTLIICCLAVRVYGYF